MNVSGIKGTRLRRVIVNERFVLFCFSFLNEVQFPKRKLLFSYEIIATKRSNEQTKRTNANENIVELVKGGGTNNAL